MQAGAPPGRRIALREQASIRGHVVEIGSILLVGSLGDHHGPLLKWLDDLVRDVRRVPDFSTVRDAYWDHRPDLVVVTDTPGLVGEGIEIVRSVHRQDRSVPIILVVAHGSEDLAVEALRAGASDYLRPPLSASVLAESVRRCLGSRHPAGKPALAYPQQSGPWPVAESRHMREILQRVLDVAPSSSTVLITGETGTGKELIAELIHRGSPRRASPFVRVNCAAIPDSLFESELFGHEKGAFTGAHLGRAGSFELANGGTIFFDEIGDMSHQAQAKILRAIETQHVQRLGGRASRPLDLRIIAATNQDLDKEVHEGRFRSDLYYRLDVVRVHLLPLRERHEDIVALLDHYVRDFSHRFKARVDGFTDQALECLLKYAWPGNVRELRNVLEAIMVVHPPSRISAAQLPERIRAVGAASADTSSDEMQRLLRALQGTNWNKSLAAKRLHWSRVTLYRKLAKYQLAAPPLTDRKPPRGLSQGLLQSEVTAGGTASETIPDSA